MPFLKVEIASLQESDLSEIMAIEKSVFKTRWPQSAFLNEIYRNKLAAYFTARRSGILAGYAGFWLVLEEVHITTLAVHPDYRRQKIGEQMLDHLLRAAAARGGRRATLEVRESNRAARELYKKFGFTVSGVRKKYYQEENENAVIMWAELEAVKETLETSP